MNTSTEVIRILQQATGQAQQANKVLDDLIVPHEYQDVAKLFDRGGAGTVGKRKQFDACR
ncbi:MAG UNVERIFIED_CONTAM: hypothetical protein LVT10_09220 [Anaerolineae bacterium]|jgi:hypothetical protein